LVHAFSNATIRAEQGAYRIGEVPAWLSPLLVLAGIAAIAAVWILAARQVTPGSPRVEDGLTPIAAITATLAAAAIISPQYLTWLLPFAAIAAVNEEIVVAVLVTGASALSVLAYTKFDSLLQGNAFPLVVVLARNAILVVLFVVCVNRLLAGACVRQLSTTLPAGSESGTTPAVEMT
jgi:hypothetical protein